MTTIPATSQRLLVMPDDGARAVVELIDQAREQLLLKQFKLQSELVKQALRRAAERGVLVRVMLNPHTSGGDRWNDEAFALLQEWGIAVAWTSDAFPVTHEKSMVVDHSAALISTFNFKDELHGSRQAKKTQIIKLPPLIPPRCTLKVWDLDSGISESIFFVK